jgi:phosphonoacetate hydrolase
MGDLAIFADRRTVFGELATETEDLAPGYRSHGSAHEAEVPLFRWNVKSPKPHQESPMNWHLLLPFVDDHAR